MASTLPEGPEWTYEIKLDGYRAQALCNGTETRLFSRNGKDLGRRFPGVVLALAAAIPHGSIVDGELVALDSFGRPSFSLIQNAATSGATFVFFAFDLLYLDGKISLVVRSLNASCYLAILLNRPTQFSSPKAFAFPRRRCSNWSEVMV